MNKRLLFLIGLGLELVAVFGLFLPYVYLMRSGTLVTLRTVPVDPRSLLRGDYVQLGYEAGQGLPADWQEPVAYAVLQKSGDVYERVRFEPRRPTLAEGEVCMRGRNGYMQAIFPDLAQYFVEEGLGRELEQARNTHRLLVDVVLSPSCKGVVRSVRLGPEVPPEEVPVDSPFAPPARPPREMPLEEATPPTR